MMRAVVLLLCAAGAAASAKGVGKHVIFLMVDSMDGRVVDPTSEVSSRVSLPFLESLAAEGVNFVRTYTPSPQCVPGRAAMLTGLRTDQIRAFDNGNGIAAEPDGTLDAACATLYDAATCARWASAQRHNGSLFDGVAAVAAATHDLAIIGKIDMGANALSVHAKANVTWGTGFHSGPSLPIVTRAADVRKPTKPNPMAMTNDANDNVHPEDWAAVAHCDDWLRRRDASESTKAFVLHCSLNIPHPSFETNATWLRFVNWTGADNAKKDWTNVSDMHPYAAYESASKAVAGHFSDADVTKVQRTYYAMCAEADYLMGRVADAAKARGFWDDALVVFTSDHGEMNMEHRQVWKNSMFEASARVPLILGGGALPPHLKRGSVERGLASLLDLFPTFMDFLGAEKPNEPLPGVRLRGASLLGPKRHGAVFSQYHSNMGPTAAFMVRSGKWKYVAYGRTLRAFEKYDPVLYDVDGDPGELRDVARDRPDVVADLDAKLRAELAAGSNAISPTGDYQAIDAYAKWQNKDVYLAFFANDLDTRLRDHDACLGIAAARPDADADPPCRFATGNASSLRDLFDAAYRGFDEDDWAKVQAWLEEEPSF